MSPENKGVYLLENVTKQNKGLQDAEISVFDTQTCNRRCMQIEHNKTHIQDKHTTVYDLCTCT